VKSFRDVRVVLLDWDGTLLDSCAADRRAYAKMFRAMGIPWSLEEFNRQYSPDWYRVYRAAGIPRSRWAEADRTWRRFYAREKPALLPGARAVLRRLDQRFTLALVTSGDRTRVMKQLRLLGLRRYFTVCVCSEDALRRKPHPAPLRTAMRRLGVKPAECLYVGDSAEDVEMSRRADVRIVGVLGPFPTHTRLRAARADALIASVRELLALLET
jgi:HAD superfamily hydrolase (TIGR01549 family)